MKHLILSTLVLASLSITGCSKKGGGNPESCEDVYSHTLSIMPDEIKAMVEKDKDKAIAKCEKMSIESRKCALEATDLESLQKCPRK